MIALALLLLGSLTPEQWQQDVAFLANELPARHISPFTRISREQFEAEASKLRQRIPAMKEHEIRAGIQRLVASLGDAHTKIRVWDRPDAWRALPLRMLQFEDGVYIFAASEPYTHLLGGRVDRIGKLPVEEAIRAIAPFISTDSEWWARHLAIVNFLRVPELLQVAGISETSDRIRFETTNGSAEIAAADNVPLVLAYKGERPVWQQRTDQAYWAAVLGGTTLYVQYNRCFDDPRRPMSVFREELLRLAETPGLQRIVLDLRVNGGGDSSVLMPWMEAVRKSRFNEKANLFVLIGPNTFSSALLNAFWMRANTAATLVGEPTGGKPNRFGDLRMFELPNSKITIAHSTKRFTLIKDSDPPSLMPDRTVGMKFTDYMAGRDPVLESVMQ